ncbi:MAG: SusC/RagA family TonB-linked outer membrane protein [Odoribacter splanchnicus]
MKKAKILGKESLQALFMFFFLLGLAQALGAQIAPGQTNQGGAIKKIIEIEADRISFNDFFKLINSKLTDPLYISYRTEDLAKVKNVSLAKCQKSVEQILKEVLEEYELTFAVTDNIVTIFRRTTPQKQESVVVKGRVIEKEDGNPIVGATVLIKGTRLGTTTDPDGKFTLSVPQQSVLVISFIGKVSKEVQPEPDKMVVIELENEQVAMDEVVVTGYANINRNTFTGNVKTIKSEDLLKVSRTNVLKAIATFDPSFRIAENNIFGSDPNALPEITIRGHSSLGTLQLDKDKFSKASLEKNPNTPTFIMDGFEVDVKKVYDLDPNRIQSITILKDAAATAMYGSRAANGVVVITTKAPKAGKIRVSYNLTGTLEVPDLHDYNLMNAKEKLDAEYRAGLFDPMEDDPYYGERAYWKKWNAIYVEGVNTDWMSKPLRNAFQHRHSLNIESGNDNIRYSFDVNYTGNNGVMKGSDRKVVGAGFKVYVNIGKLYISNDVTYNNTVAKESPYGSFGDYTHLLPYNRYQDEKGNLLKSLESWNEGVDIANPLYEATLGNFIEQKQDEIIDNLQLRWDFGKGFMANGSIGLKKSWINNTSYIDPRSMKSSVKLETDNLLAGDLYTTTGNSSSWNIRLGGSYNASLGRNDLNFSVNGEIDQDESFSVNTHYVGFAEGTSADINYASKVEGKPGKTQHLSRYVALNGIFNYSFDNIYLADLSVRYEGSSVFGKNQQSTPYWSGGIGLNIHNYEFMKKSEWLSRLKVRASYGQVGNINFEPHMSHNYFKALFDDWYITGFGTNLYYMGNPDLKSEKTNTLDVSFDLGLLNDKITLTATYYNKKTQDMINDVTIPSSAGFSTYKDNIGEIRNRGVELSLYATVLSRENWFLSVYGNFARNQEKFLKIAESLKRYNELVNERYQNYKGFENNSDFAEIYTKYEEGGSTTALYGMRSLGIDPANGQEVFLDRSGHVTYDYDPREQVIIGDTEPKGQGTFGFNLRWKSLTLSTVFQYEFGADRYNETLVNYVENARIESENVDRRVLTDRWEKPGDMRQLKDIKDRKKTTRPTSRFMQKYNLLSMNSMTLQYEFGKKITRALHLERMRIEANTGELFRICSVKQERGLSYPFARNFNFTLMVNF